MQVPEEVPAGHLHHSHWEVLRGDVYQPLQQTPRFPAGDTEMDKREPCDLLK